MLNFLPYPATTPTDCQAKPWLVLCLTANLRNLLSFALLVECLLLVGQKCKKKKKTVLLKKIKTHIAGLRHTAVHALLNNITARGWQWNKQSMNFNMITTKHAVTVSQQLHQRISLKRNIKIIIIAIIIISSNNSIIIHKPDWTWAIAEQYGTVYDAFD